MSTTPIASRRLFPLPMTLPLALIAFAAPAALAKGPVEEVVITAKGYASDPLETPQAIEVLTPQAGPAPKPVGSLFRGEPGLSVHTDGAWGQNPVLRGLKKESMVILVDGLRLNSAQPQGSIASFLDLGLLERTEVVKGPTSVLYGSGAMGGVVNLITVEPRFTEQLALGGRIGTSASSVDRGLASSLVANASNENHGLVLGVGSRNAGDYHDADGRVRNSGYRSRSLLAKYHYRIGEDGALRVNVQQHTDHDVWYLGSARTGGQPGGAGIPVPLGTVTIRSPEQRRELYSVGLDIGVGLGDLSTEVYRHRVYREIRAFSDRLGRNYVRNDVFFDTDGAHAKYRFPLGEWQQVTIGAETWRMTADPERYIHNNPPFFDNDVRNDPFDDGSLRSTGAFVQDEITFGDTHIVAGLSFDRIEGKARAKGAGPGLRTTGLDHTDDTLSWSIGVIHELDPALRVYANVGRAWRAADMRERFEDAARGDGFYHVGNPQLDPEQSLSFELGLKGQSDELSYRVAAFHTRIDDYIAGRITGAAHPQTGLPIKQTENLDRAVIYGVDGGATLPVGAFVADASFTWLRGENRQDREALYQMPAPEVRVGLGQPADRGFYWHAQLRAVARQDRIAKRFSAGTENETAGFATVDVAMGWRFDRIGPFAEAGVNLRLENLLDRGYHEHLTDGLSGREIQAPGRGAIVSLTGSF